MNSSGIYKYQRSVELKLCSEGIKRALETVKSVLFFGKKFLTRQFAEYFLCNCSEYLTFVVCFPSVRKKEIKCWCCPRTSGISSGSCWIWCICLKTKILSKACSFLFWFGFLKIKFTFLTVHQETLLLLELRLSILELCELSVSLFWKIFLCWHNGRGMQILT